MSRDNFYPGILQGRCINIRDPFELRNWARALGATKEEITNAVFRVGPSIEKVVAHLSKHQQ